MSWTESSSSSCVADEALGAVSRPGYSRSGTRRSCAGGVPFDQMKLDDAVRAFLDAPRFAVLGTLNPDESPQLSVIWYERRGDEAVVNTTAPRMKARNMNRDPRVSLLVGESEQYVRLDGDARLVATGADALRDIRALAVRYNGEDAAMRQTRDVWSKQERVTYAIRVDRVYKYEFD